MAKVIREIGKGFSRGSASLLDAVNLLMVSMDFRSLSDSFKAFADFAEAVMAKFNMLEVQSSREDNFFYLWLLAYDEGRHFLLSFFFFLFNLTPFPFFFLFLFILSYTLPKPSKSSPPLK